MTKKFDKAVDDILNEVLRGSKKRFRNSVEEHITPKTGEKPKPRYGNETGMVSKLGDYRPANQLHRGKQATGNKRGKRDVHSRYTTPKYTGVQLKGGKDRATPNQRAINMQGRGHTDETNFTRKSVGNAYNSKVGETVVKQVLPTGQAIVGPSPRRTKRNHAKNLKKRMKDSSGPTL